MDLERLLKNKRITSANRESGAPAEVGRLTHASSGIRLSASTVMWGNWLAYYEPVDEYNADTGRYIRTGLLEFWEPDYDDGNMCVTIGSAGYVTMLGTP